MKTTKYTLFSSILVLGLCSGSVHAADSHGSHWGYEGQSGPTHWGDMSHDFHMCKDGKSQSPIELFDATTGALGPIELHYDSMAESIVNNGHTIQVNMAKGSHITVGGKTYELLQFHFHSPSEHTINGKHADMVAHFVHKAADGQLGVIGVLINKGESNATLASFWKDLPKHAGDKIALHTKTNVAELIPANMTYYNYSGSLTTPPCSEGVNWMVVKTPIQISAEQLAAYTALYHDNVRPVQALNGRKISSR